ncbi:MarR family transcriptional regulator [Rhodophyticola sp. CCM32]|uniref:MarR family winged helix-turn-helix transcriptional regulator n=1 Tax=Rhodophyticola sp. CCM32 TaxID=2916397 RepID=UPI00107FB6EC|nr:MarR family transcriptional regulator [Rhodophyticola sp. CCM32]QBY01383.1 MarR family transcriptional regulator [Rhodophyticola sp. CCM32]
MTKPGDRFVDGYLLYLLAAASEQASADFHAQVRATGLRVPEWRVLACLIDSDPMMVTELAGLSLLEQSRMTKTIDQMDTRGLVSRISDAADRRRVRVTLTDAGKALAEDLVAKANAQEARLLASLADTDAARIKPVLQALLEALQPGA